MNELKDTLVALARAIAEERKDSVPVNLRSTDALLNQCVYLLSRSYTHIHVVNDVPLSEKERDLMLMSHARHACLRQGHLHNGTEGAMKYMAGHMDGQRKVLPIMEELSLALRQFKGAHPCTDNDATTCPTHRSAEEVINKFNTWKQKMPVEPI